MTQGGDGSGFAEEARGGEVVAGGLAGGDKDFESDRALQGGIEGPKDHAHASAADHGFHLISGKAAEAAWVRGRHQFGEEAGQAIDRRV